MSNLVIVESPAKAKTIQKYLGKGYEVVASMGHVRDLPKSTLGVNVEDNFKPKSTWPPTRTGRGRPSPGIWPTCSSWTSMRPIG